MSISHLLEDFGLGIDGPLFDAVVQPQDVSENLRLEAYEDGYKAGWDDAVGANQAEQMQVAADLAQNLRDMSFTYQEACSHVSNSLQGVFDAMLSLFLPEIARAALAPKVAEELEKLQLSSADVEIILSVAPESRSILERLVDQIPDKEVIIKEDNSLTSGQVVISFGESEVSVDFDALLDEMRRALDTFQHETRKEVHNG